MISSPAPMPPALAELLPAQTASGAFPSTVSLPTGPVPDENGFITALVLHELAGFPPTPDLRAAQERALDFLLRCERRDQPGCFAFYPPGAQPDWMPIPLPPDADDTALITLALARAGRWSRHALEHIARHRLAPFRLLHLSAIAKPWHRVGAYFTWLDEMFYPNVVDLCVNVNVAILLKTAGLAEEMGLMALVEMIEAGIDWAGASAQRSFLLTPFYPQPHELVHAVGRAVELGVSELAPCRDKLSACPWGGAHDPNGWSDDRAICSSHDGRIVWRAPVLQRARRARLAHSALCAS